MEKLLKIKERCKCRIFLRINEHRNYYQTIQEGIDEVNQTLENCRSDLLTEEMTKKMIEHNTIIDLQFYPRTPIGSYSIYHYDLEMALDEALEILKNDQN